MRDRPTFTASLVAAARAAHAQLPAPYNITTDFLAEKLLPFPFAISTRILRLIPALGVWMCLGAGSPIADWTTHIALRTRAIDDFIGKLIRAGICQLVILGAGLDSRVLRMPELYGIPIFEIDRYRTQRYKTARLRALGIPSEQVQRVCVELQNEPLGPALSAHGFDPAKPSVWICEGVTMYLCPAAVAALFLQVGQLAAVGSQLAVTYMPRDIRSAAGFVALASIVAGSAGEPFRTALSENELHTMLGQAGFIVVLNEDRIEWAARYYPSARQHRVFERLCVAEKV